jgi:hypothetical protein
MTTTQLPAPWHGKHPLDLDTSTLALLLEAIAADAERAPDRTISSVGLADILLAASDRLLEAP